MNPEERSQRNQEAAQRVIDLADTPTHCYRKKPIVIEAFQMTRKRRDDNSEWPNWLHKAWNKRRSDDGALVKDAGGRLAIFTLEGVMTIDWDDWIIQGVKDELYPCKPDIFEATYEKVG